MCPPSLWHEFPLTFPKMAQEGRSVSGHLQRPQFPQQQPEARRAGVARVAPDEDVLHTDDAGED